MKKVTLSISLILFIVSAFAQKGNYTDGYIVTLTGDIIQKKILNFKHDKSGVKSCRKVICLDENNYNITYRPRDIRAYKRGDEIYESKSFINPDFALGLCSKYPIIRFMKKIEDGEVTLYNYDFRSWIFLTYMGLPIPIHYKLNYVQKKGEEVFQVITGFGQFKSIFSEYFNECQAVSDKIGKKHYRYRDIKQIVREYNSCVRNKKRK